MKFQIVPCLILVCVSVQAPAQSPTDYFTQPREAPAERSWKTEAQTLPALEEIMARPPQKLPVYGIYLWGSEYEKAHEEIRKMGVRSLRISGPASEAEEALRIAARNGIEVMYTVSNATMRERRPGLKWTRNPYPDDAAYLEALAESFRMFLDRYSPGGSFFKDTGLQSPVAAIEILNEPNFQYMIEDRLPRAEVEAEREALYAKVLPLISELIRQHPHRLPIVGFACGGGGDTRADQRFVQGVYRDGGEGLHASYDLFSTHPYMGGAPPESFKIKPWGPVAISANLKNMRGFLSEKGAEKPVWFTEVGWEIGHEHGGKFPDNPKRKLETLTAEFHGAYVLRMYLWAMRLGVDRVHIMHMHDTDNFNSGLVNRETLAWRPAAYAIQNVVRRLPNPRLTGAQSDGKDDAYIYEFQADAAVENSGKVIVAWRVTGPAELEIQVEGERATLYDMAGNSKPLPVTDGKVLVTIGPYPLYIESAK